MTFQPILYNVSTALGMVIIGFTVAKWYRQNNVHTVSEMLEHLFGSEAKNLCHRLFDCLHHPVVCANANCCECAECHF